VIIRLPKHEGAARKVRENPIPDVAGHERIRMSGLGILEVKTRAARTGRNPATGESIQIKPSKKVGFRPAKELKEAV
jgi:nucleoid DNA-binding protein